jgi:hypothetical protein
MFKKYMQNLSNERLMKAFEELQDMISTGVLEGDVTRGLIGVYKDYYPTADASISIIEKEVYYEMAMRYYAKTNNIIVQLEEIREDDNIRFADQVVNRAIRIVKESK